MIINLERQLQGKEKIMVLDWMVRIILVIAISCITLNGYESGLRGLWLIGYVALQVAVVYGMIAVMAAVGAVWIVMLAIGLTFALIL